MTIKMVNTDQYELWYIHDERSDRCIKEGKYADLYWHRVGGPARIHRMYGTIKFWVDNHRIYDVGTYCKMCNFSDEETLIWVLKYGDYLPKYLDEF